jgi:folate-binding Fe-S cluster repair protein YgfZ
MTSCLHLARRTLLAFRGPDALRYLNGQVSQEIRGLDASDDVRPACVTDAKGRLQAFVHVCRGAGEGELWLEAPAELEEELEARLGRYLIADDAELENLSAAWELWHLTDTTQAPADLPAGAIVRKSNRLGEPGLDLWLPPGIDPGLPRMSLAEAEARRIAARIPSWGAELTTGAPSPTRRAATSARKCSPA